MLRHCFVYGAITLSLGFAAFASAQTGNRPHLDLVRGLRKENLKTTASKSIFSPN